MGTDKWGHFFQQGYWYFELLHGMKGDAQATLMNQYGQYLEGDPAFPKGDKAILSQLNTFSRQYNASMKFGYFGSVS